VVLDQLAEMTKEVLAIKQQQADILDIVKQNLTRKQNELTRRRH
jgi:hypothetical protein